MFKLPYNPLSSTNEHIGELRDTSVTTVYVGDIHGDYGRIAELCFNYRDLVIVQVGDFNAGMKYFDMDVWDQILDKTNCYLVVMRGNHDDPNFFRGMPLTNSGRLAFVSDYTQLNINGVHHLFVGGAHSIDRKHLIAERPDKWFSNEPSPSTNHELLAGIKEVNVLCTHSASNQLPPYTHSQIVMQYVANDKTLLQDLVDEHQELTELLNLVRPKGLTHHYYGHFHQSLISEIDGVKHRCLGINEAYGCN